MSATRRRLAHALLICALGLVMGAALGTGTWLEHAAGRATRPLHELLGWGAGAAVVLHVALRWRWFASVARGWSRLKGPVRTNLLLGTFLTTAVGLEVTSGALLDSDLHWRGLHHAVSKVVIVLSVWHVVRHWAWLKARLAPWTARRAPEKAVLAGGRPR